MPPKNRPKVRTGIVVALLAFSETRLDWIGQSEDRESLPIIIFFTIVVFTVFIFSIGREQPPTEKSQMKMKPSKQQR